MSPPSASRTGTARLAVVGATAPAGRGLREALATFGVPGSRVSLYAAAQGEALLGEYAGEARLIQEPSVEEIAGHDIIFLCEPGELARSAARARNGGSVVLDLAGCLEPGRGARVAHVDINPEVTRDQPRFLSAPHPIALVLAEALYALERRLGIEEIVATVLRPASDFGQSGLNELREQTVRLLSFSEAPVETFGRQLAFNILTQRDSGAEPQELESRIAAQVGELLGWSRDRMALKLLTAPVFHGHCMALRFRLRRQAERIEVQEVLNEGRFFEPPRDDAAATPLEVSTRQAMVPSQLVRDGLGGFGLWVVIGETAARSAEHAVRLADSLGDL